MEESFGKFYGKYKKITSAVWQIFIEYNINYLPVNVMGLIKQMDISILSYSSGAQLIEELKILEICVDNEAFSLFLNGRWIIFYNESIIPRSRIRFTLAHELGHILLGHRMKIVKSSVGEIVCTEKNNNNNLDYEREKKQQIEIDADMFATRLLAPAIVFYSLGITNPEDIMYLCGLPIDVAKSRSTRFKKLIKREKFFLTLWKKRFFPILEILSQIIPITHIKKDIYY